MPKSNGVHGFLHDFEHRSQFLKKWRTFSVSACQGLLHLWNDSRLFCQIGRRRCGQGGAISGVALHMADTGKIYGL
ncbi:hypothetical protein CJA_3273 [Cellvibrio japonicus Ueda107]|uniref:Uncharacterized protein n=1 Tax=Cellvibrio japonicus (strain Ueda107) TaxID=498211 RepID=B3PEH1_CELJU|nr:hypothetical protein CJA_3273 [Cellvibrio japonicus Ueda107]